MNTDWHELIQRHIAGMTTEEEAAFLQESLKRDDAVAGLYLRYMNLDVALEAHATSAEEVTRTLLAAPVARQGWLQWLPLTAAAAGIVLGLFGASVAWAIASPRAMALRLFELADGSFEKQSGRVASGFPAATGAWSGDEAQIVTVDTLKAKEGRQVLRFVRPEGDSGVPNSPAISCDVYQLVDLRPLREQIAEQGDSVLELSASFLDAREPNTNPSVTFFCQIYLFRGDPTALHQVWPLNITDALSSGSAQITTLGSDGNGWRTQKAKCLVTSEADFAVVQIAARPNLRPAKLDLLFADDVQLTLKTSPTLPVRVVRR